MLSSRISHFVICEVSLNKTPRQENDTQQFQTSSSKKEKIFFTDSKNIEKVWKNTKGVQKYPIEWEKLRETRNWLVYVSNATKQTPKYINFKI